MFHLMIMLDLSCRKGAGHYPLPPQGNLTYLGEAKPPFWIFPSQSLPWSLPSLPGLQKTCCSCPSCSRLHPLWNPLLSYELPFPLEASALLRAGPGQGTGNILIPIVWPKTKPLPLEVSMACFSPSFQLCGHLTSLHRPVSGCILHPRSPACPQRVSLDQDPSLDQVLWYLVAGAPGGKV